MLDKVTLPNTNLRTSVAGFGCVGLTAVNDEARAGELVHRALDRGVTHFDVAPLYGLGRAELILGRFLEGRRGQVTVTTKFGLAPPKLAAQNPNFVAFAKRILRRLPVAKRLAHRYAAQRTRSGAFSVRDAELSLHTSLRNLRTDYVDVLLLHEGGIEDARNEELLAFVDREMARGTVRNYGLGSASHRVVPDLNSYPAAVKIFQFENDVLAQQKHAFCGTAGRSFITHGALRPLSRIAEAARANRLLAQEIESETGIRLTDETELGRLLLQRARFDNPDGIVIFGSTRVDHIDDNVAALGRPVEREQMKLLSVAISKLLSRPSNTTPSR
jgi:aryl-alcohol dehydrogenase-like predicted oxidoreductase